MEKDKLPQEDDSVLEESESKLQGIPQSTIDIIEGPRSPLKKLTKKSRGRLNEFFSKFFHITGDILLASGRTVTSKEIRKKFANFIDIV